MKNKDISIASIGDCCVDIYPDQNKIFLGGTAFNVAVQAKKAGVEASLISIVGNDQYGEKYFQQCSVLGINTEYLAKSSGKTSSVQIPLDSEGRPVFSGWELGVLPELELHDKHQQFLEKHTAVRGILLKPLQRLFKSFSGMKLDNTVKVGDFAGGSQYSVEKEAIIEYIYGIDIIVRSVNVKDREELAFLKELAHKHNKIVIVLLGKDGSIVFTNTQVYQQPAIAAKVTDTTGAGDAYIAYFLIKYLKDKDIQKAMEAATFAASEVITYLGATS